MAVAIDPDVKGKCMQARSGMTRSQSHLEHAELAFAQRIERRVLVHLAPIHALVAAARRHNFEEGGPEVSRGPL